MTRRWAWREEEDPNRFDGRPVRRLGDSLAEVASDLHLDNPDVLGAVLSGWAEVVGEMIAEHTRPRTLREGVLLVEVDSPEWATQMRYLEEELLKRLGRRTRPGAVKSVTVVVRRQRPD